MCLENYELLKSVIVGLVTGMVTGLYSGFIVTRYHNFLNIKNEALRAIQKIDYILAGSKIEITNNRDIGNLIYISSDLCRLKHKNAGTAICELQKEISTINSLAETGKVSIENYKEYHLKWQESVRNLSPNKLVIFLG